MKTKKHRRMNLKSKKKTTRVTVDFPETQHRKLKAIAALEGVTLQDYIHSRAIKDLDDINNSDSDLKPIIKKIIKKNKKALKRLADK